MFGVLILCFVFAISELLKVHMPFEYTEYLLRFWSLEFLKFIIHGPLTVELSVLVRGSFEVFLMSLGPDLLLNLGVFLFGYFSELC